MLTNKQVAERFAQGYQDGASDNMFIKDNTVYSYGLHWPIARRENGLTMVNTDRYSSTTSKHTSLVKNALQANVEPFIEVNREALK
jgi:hypothetical protein